MCCGLWITDKANEINKKLKLEIENFMEKLILCNKTSRLTNYASDYYDYTMYNSTL